MCRRDEIGSAVEANVKARADYFLEGERKLEGNGEGDLTWKAKASRKKVGER